MKQYLCLNSLLPSSVLQRFLLIVKSSKDTKIELEEYMEKEKRLLKLTKDNNVSFIRFISMSNIVPLIKAKAVKEYGNDALFFLIWMEIGRKYC